MEGNLQGRADPGILGIKRRPTCSSPAGLEAGVSQLAPPWGEGEERCPQGILIPDSFLCEDPLWATPPLQEPPDHSTPWLGWPTHIFHPRSF